LPTLSTPPQHPQKNKKQLIGTYMGAAEWAAARETCGAWRAQVTGGVDLLELDLERLPHRWMMVLACVRAIFPRLRSAVLLVGSRVPGPMFAERMLELAVTLPLTGERV
jgi:hypothetical protein